VKARLPRSSFGLDSIKFIALALGVLALFCGIGLFLVENDLTVPVRVAIAAGIVLIGAYVAIDPEDALHRIATRGTMYGGNSLLMAVAVLGILGLVNVMANRAPFEQRLDLTANKQFTLSDQSVEILRQLPTPVSVTGYFVDMDRSQRETAESLLKQYQAAAPGKLSYDFVDPEQRPSQAQQDGVRQSGTVVFHMADQKQTATNPAEQDFTAALLKLANPTPRKVYFTTGHGERDTSRPDEAGYSTLLTLLQRENMTADTVNLLTARKVPDDATVLVIAAPSNPFMDDEKKAIQDYLAAGGSLMLLFDLKTNPQVADFVSQWNVQVKMDPVIDPASSLPQDPLTPIVSRYIFHDITKNMNGVFTVWPVTATLIFPKDQAEGVFTAPLVESTDRSWSESSLDEEIQAQKVQFDQGKDTQGPITLMGVIEANAAQQPPVDPNNPQAPPKKTRVVVVADADFVSNQVLRLQSGNPDLFVNSMNWLTASEQLISIRPKDNAPRQIVLTGSQANLLFWSSAVFLPLIVLAAGAFVWWTRR
jgi:ABC-type uncharacterized transport system involved in gliding motility auxiliary subunit